MNGKEWENVKVDIKSYFERIIDERDGRYNERFVAAEKAVATALAAAEKAVSAALIAQEKMTTAAFASSEKAIIKAEEAQRESNLKTNEFRGQLSDQAETLMPRKETVVLIDSLRTENVAQHRNQEDRMSSLSKDVATLREENSKRVGQSGVSIGLLIAIIGPVCTIIGGVVVWLITRGGAP